MTRRAPAPARAKLPARPSLEHLRAQAKDLLDAVRQGAPEARERMHQGLPAARNASPAQLAAMTFALHDAQSVIAREYGFGSWPELKAEVERLESPAPLSPESLRALLERVAQTPPPPEVQQALLEASAAPSPALSLPAELPLVPLRNVVLSVGAVAPLMIGRSASIAAVAVASQSGQLLALFGQRDEVLEAPGVADLYPVGCVAALHAQFPAPEGALHVVVKGLEWVRLTGLSAAAPYARAQVDRFEVQEQPTSESRELEQRLRERVRAYVAGLPDSERLLRWVDSRSALQLADSTIANLKCPMDVQAEYAAEPDLQARLRRVLRLLEQGA